MLGLGASLNGSLIKEGDDVYFECRVRFQNVPPVFLSAGKSSCSKINLFINQGKPEGIQDLLEMQCESSFGTFIQNISFPGSVLSVFQKLMLSTGENAPKQLWGWSFIAFICCKCFKTVRMLLQMQKCARSDHSSAIWHKQGWMHLCLPFSFTTPLPNVSFKLQLMQPSFGNCDLQSKLDFPSPRTTVRAPGSDSNNFVPSSSEKAIWSSSTAPTFLQRNNKRLKTHCPIFDAGTSLAAVVINEWCVLIKKNNK